MGIARRCHRLGMAKQLSKVRKSLTKGQAVGRRRVTNIVDTAIWQIWKLSDSTPRFLPVSKILVFDITNNGIGIANHAQDRFQQFYRNRSKEKRFTANRGV